MADYAIHDTTLTDISNVIRKKEGSSALIDPADYADRINLMGMLEEKTASGALVNISDGADDVPIKALSCSIVPQGGNGTPSSPVPITGTSKIKLTHSKKNLLPMVNYDGGVYNPDIDRQLNLTVSETQFTKNGNVYSVTTSVSWKTFTVLFPIISGATYYEKWTLSVESGQQGSTRAYLDEDFKVLAKYNNNSSDPITTNMIMTPPTGAKYLAITWTNRGTAVQTLKITEPQIEIGSSASAFEAYEADTYEIDIPPLGKNLLNDAGTGTGTIWYYYDNGILLEKDKPYTFSCENYGAGSIAIYATDHTTQFAYSYMTANSAKVTYTPTEDIYVCPRIYRQGLTPSTVVNPMLEQSEDKTSYEPYKPCYDGTYAEDGTLTSDMDKDSMSSTYLSGLNSDYIGYEASTAWYDGHPSIWVRNWHYQQAKPRQSGGIKTYCCYFPATMHNTTIFSAQYRIYFDVYGKNISSVQDFIDYVESIEQNGGSLEIAYEIATPIETQIDPLPQINTHLGVNNFWTDVDGGETEVTYRASGTITPVVPTLISKTITANGTYSAEDDDADGYDEVVVNVPSGTPFKYESVDSSGLSYVFIAMEEGDYLCVLYCSYDGTRTFSTTGTLIFEEDINVAGDSRGIKVALCHLLPNQRISHQATTVSLYNSTLQAIIRLDDSISVSQMVDSYAINDGDTSGYTPSYSGNVLSVAVCGGNNTEHFYDKTIPSDSAIENSVNGGLNSILHIGYGACPNYDMYGYYGNGVYIGLFQ